MACCDFWMKRGVAGFRIDAVSRLFEDPDMRDDPYLPGTMPIGDRNIQHKYTDDLPEVHDVLKEVRKRRRQVSGQSGAGHRSRRAERRGADEDVRQTATKCSCRWTSRLPM